VGKGSKKRRSRRKRAGKGPSRPRQWAGSAPPRRTSPSPRATAITMVFCAVFLGLAPLLGSGYMLAGALGLVGHRGVFTATNCVTTGAGRGRGVTCGGELVAPPQPARHAFIHAELPLDRPTAVQVLGRGPLETVGPAAISGWSTFGMAGLTVLTAATLTVFRERLSPRFSRTARRLLLVLGSLTLAGLVVYLGVRAVT
jgi:hypothetical protein